MSESARKLVINLILILLLWLLFSHIFCLRICHDRQLYPSVCDGDLLIALRTGSPSEGDIVILPSGTAARYQGSSDTGDILGVVIFLIRRRGF